LGLDRNSFISRQAEMSKDFILKLTEELVNFSLPSTETIIAGVDPDGSHIYTLINDDIRCDDSVGFSSIGIGYWHANSQFMLARYNFVAVMADSLLLTYIAKRRAEIAPGVGTGTVMFTVGPQLGSYTRISEEVLQQLEKTYQAILKQEAKGLEHGRKEIQKYVARLSAAAAAATQKQAASTTDGGEKQTDKKLLPDDTKKEGKEGDST
jgi:hypothetical protein